MRTRTILAAAAVIAGAALLGAGVVLGRLTAPGQPTTAFAQDQKAEPAPAKRAEFSAVKINQQDDVPALDFYLNGKARAVRFFTPEQKDPRAYFNESGQFYTNGWVTISGTMSGKGGPPDHRQSKRRRDD